MPVKEIEVILSRQLADSLSIPIFLVDPKGDLIFYNEPAEGILGKRFEDTGPMPMKIWSTIFKIKDDDGILIPQEDLPLVKSLTLQIPAQSSFWLESLSGERHHISVTSLPLIGEANRFLGALAIFWKNEDS
ncbi:MAG: PAS domain-containing protein [Saprospiraceae bacterium]|nr:PAS domain-containing protein [Saprospiraceae bacterium]